MSERNGSEVRVEQLERREAELVEMLQRCIPPVDQHRHELQVIRGRIAMLRGGAEDGCKGIGESDGRGK